MDSNEALTNDFSKFVNVSNPVLTNISSCLWSSVSFGDLASVWISDNKTKYFTNHMTPDGNTLVIGGLYATVEFTRDFFVPDRWVFLCFTYNNIKKKLEVYLNSEKMFDKIIKKDLDSFVLDKDFLQYEKFGMVGKFAGRLTDLNVWSRILDSLEIRKLYMCEVLVGGPDIVDWKSGQLVPGRNIVVSAEVTHPCHEHAEDESKLMIYDVKLSMEPARSALRICYALGGSMDSPKSLKDLETIKENCESCVVWVPIFNEYEGWIGSENHIPEYLPWGKGEPTGGNSDKCAILGTDDLAYFAVTCKWNVQFYCKIKNFQIFRLKGMCVEKEGNIDRKYVMKPKNIKDKRPTWRGFSANSIQWNENKTRWEINETENNETIASLRKKDFPVGEGIWDIESDNICLEKPKNDKLKLMLSNCGQYEFSCSDGTCIPIEKKCDFVPNCWDKGDEMNCQLVNNEDMEGYDSNIPDIDLDETGNILKKIIKVSTTIKEVGRIEEVKSRFSATFILELEWTDARFTWYDLNQDENLNIPSKELKKNIWFPKILITNSEDNTVVQNDADSKLCVRRNGSLRMSSEENLRESALFHGKENSIVYSRQFTEDFKCVFDLSFFPFDTQSCSISFNVGNKERHFIDLIGKNVDFIGNQKLSTFDLIRFELEDKDITKDIDVKVNIILKRQISQHLLSIYLPSLFIMVIAQATLFFSKEHFKTSIPVSITAMLVMYTLNNSIASKLPQTSTIKFIDIWIIYGLFLHFLIIILLVLIEHLPGANNLVFLENSKTTETQREEFRAKDATRAFAQKILPVLEIIFIICYSICALIIYN